MSERFITMFKESNDHMEAERKEIELLIVSDSASLYGKGKQTEKVLDKFYSDLGKNSKARLAIVEEALNEIRKFYPYKSIIKEKE